MSSQQHAAWILHLSGPDPNNPDEIIPCPREWRDDFWVEVNHSRTNSQEEDTTTISSLEAHEEERSVAENERDPPMLPHATALPILLGDVNSTTIYNASGMACNIPHVILGGDTDTEDITDGDDENGDNTSYTFMSLPRRSCRLFSPAVLIMAIVAVSAIIVAIIVGIIVPVVIANKRNEPSPTDPSTKLPTPSPSDPLTTEPTISPTDAAFWHHIGQDLDGEAPGDEFGRSVALSADGNILAVGGGGK